MAAVRADELSPARAAADRRYLAVPAAALVALVVLLVLALLHASARDTRLRQRTAVLTAARQEAVNLTTIDTATITRDLDRIIAGATGTLRQQFASERAHAQALATEPSRSRGSVLSAGLVHLDASAGAAQVVIAADAEVTTTPAGTTTPQSTLKHYRMVLRLRRIGGRWLVSDVAFAGVPQ
ncbi:MAG: hypothetical protein JO222_11905 [Frankiales bacterium]|nr:hypothetical protein [Frankiales bacterium]